MEAFRLSTVEGVSECFDYDSGRLHILRKVSRRNNSRDHVADKLRDAIGSRPDVVIRDENQTTIYGLLGRYDLKIKKADEGGEVELGKTQLSMNFQCQAQTRFSGAEFQPIINLYLSYIDTEDPRDPTVVLICPKDGGIHWMEEIRRPSSSVVLEITPPPLEPDPAGDDLVRVIPKPEEEAK